MIADGPFAGLQRHGYRVVLADPPWVFSGGTKGRPQHYARMTDRELMRLPVEDLAHPDGCWLFLWTTSPRLFLTDRIAEAWGFRYSGRGFVWIKTERSKETDTPLFVFKDGLHTGHGYTTRKNAEDALIFRRGAPKRQCAAVHEIILAPIREHSRKPVEQYERIERFAEGPYVELFARQSRPGWDSWGLEKGKFDAEAA